MLKSLYDYAIRNKLSLPPGYVNKKVKAYIVLSSKSDDFADIILDNEKEIAAPDIGSLANGTDKSNVLLEKRSIVFPTEPTLKSAFYLSAMKDAARYEPLLNPCIRAIENPGQAEKICQLLDREKIKPSDKICFQVDYRNVLESDAVRIWWSEYRKQFTGVDAEQLERCLITGNLTTPMRTAGSVTGLQTVGGHSRGDALICFDKSAFESYNLKQAANAPVSEEAMAAVNTALTALLKKAPTLTGMKLVHWYDCDVPLHEDPFPILIDIASTIEVEEESEEEMDYQQEKAQAAEQRFRTLIESVESGTHVTPLNAQYHILMLSGVNGRVRICRYELGTYGEMVAALKQWEEDLSLTNVDGTGILPARKLTARFVRLLKYQKGKRDIYKRMDKELSALGPAVLHSIINGKALLPDTIAARALNYIRSELMSSQENDQPHIRLDPIAEQWLKAWLIRSRNKGGKIMSSYNPEYYELPYYCGALLAVYGAIQTAAMGNVNASVIDRYYGSAIQTPALVIGALSRQSKNHLGNLSGGARYYYETILSEITSKIGNRHFPATLNLEQQSEFSLGYYQMIARLNRERIEARDAKKQAMMDQIKEEN